MHPLLIISALAAGALTEPLALKGESLTFEIDAAPFANLIYGLNAITGVTVSSSNAFREAWSSNNILRPADEALLKEWTRLTDRYPQYLDFADVVPDLPFQLSHGPSMEWKEKFTIAGYSAKTPEEFREHLGLLVSPTDVPAFMDVVDRFYPRFLTWYEAQGHPAALRFADGMRALMEHHHMLDFTQSMARFYGSAIPKDQVLHFHIMFRPRTVDERQTGHLHTNATVPENHAAIEMVDDEKPKDRIDVVMHELFHFLYWTRPLDLHVQQAKAFAASGNPAAVGLYTILDEAIAAAAGNGIIAQKVMDPAAFEKMVKKDGLYDEPFINSMAKALMPVLEETLKKGGQMDDAFAQRYLALADKTLGKEAQSLQLLLKMRNLVVFDEKQRPYCRQVKQSFRAVSNSTNVGEGHWTMQRYPHMSGVVMLRRDQLEQLKEHAALVDEKMQNAIANASDGKRGVALGFKRAVDADLYVLVAVDDAAMQELIKAFVAPRMRFEGVGVVIP